MNFKENKHALLVANKEIGHKSKYREILYVHVPSV
jgi:hypothetical protein